MKTGKTLTDLAAEIMRQAESKRDYRAVTSQLEVVNFDNDSAPMLSLGRDATFQIGEVAHGQLSQWTGIPKPYYDRMRTDAPALLARNINNWLHKNSEQRLVRTLDGKVRAFLSSRFAPLDNFDLAEAVLPAISKLELELVSCEVTERKLYLKAVHHSIQRDIEKVAPGARMGDGGNTIFDTCVPAMLISNSEVGLGQLLVETGMLTRACTNLAWFADSGMKRRHLGARHETLGGMDGYAELLTDETKRVTDQALWMQVRDVVSGAFNEAVFDKHIARIQDAAREQIPGDPVAIVEVTAKKLGLTDDERGGVLQHLFRGGDLSRYGLFNAITRTAEDCKDYDRATDLERLGPKVIDLSPADWKEVVAA